MSDPIQIESTAQPAENQAVAPRLLLVDDNEMVRGTLAKILESGGFRVSAAANVNEALKLIGSEPFDALLSDLHMPGAGTASPL